MKKLGASNSPLDGILVHHRVTPCIKFDNGGDRHSCVKCPVQEHNTMTPARTWTWTTPSRLVGPVSWKPQKLFGPAKPFLDNLYLKTERCTRLRLLVWREPLSILTWTKQLHNHKVWDFATAFRVQKRFRTFLKRAPVHKLLCHCTFTCLIKTVTLNLDMTVGRIGETQLELNSHPPLVVSVNAIWRFPLADFDVMNKTYMSKHQEFTLSLKKIHYWNQNV